MQTDVWLELNDLGLAPGVSFFIKEVKVTKNKGFISLNVAGTKLPSIESKQHRPVGHLRIVLSVEPTARFEIALFTFTFV